MNALSGLWRDTWWLWCAFAIGGIFMAIFVHPIFLVIFPMSIVSFIYFGLLRYDKDGNIKSEDD